MEEARSGNDRILGNGVEKMKACKKAKAYRFEYIGNEESVEVSNQKRNKIKSMIQ